MCGKNAVVLGEAFLLSWLYGCLCTRVFVEMGEAFEHAMQDLSKDETLRAVVISGSGKAFSAGGDYDFLLARASVSPAENAREMRALYVSFSWFFPPL